MGPVSHLWIPVALTAERAVSEQIAVKMDVKIAKTLAALMAEAVNLEKNVVETGNARLKGENAVRMVPSAILAFIVWC